MRIQQQDDQLKEQSSQIEVHRQELNRLNVDMAKVMELIGIQGEMLKQNAPAATITQPQAAADKVGQATGSSVTIPKDVAAAVSVGSAGVAKASNAISAGGAVAATVASSPNPSPSSSVKKFKFQSTFLWKIPTIERDIDKVELSDKQSVIAGGYKLIIICSKPLHSHMALIVKPVRGENDDDLPWPMRATISFSLMKSEQEKNKTSFTTNNKVISKAFDMPLSFFTRGESGQVGAELPYYCPHNSLKNYIVNGQLSLKVNVKEIDDSVKVIPNVKLCPNDRLLSFLSSHDFYQM